MTAALARGDFVAARLEAVFARCFLRTENTCLIGGAEEPLYAPAESRGERHCIYYREDFFASALHEVAHWCIAGPERRTQRDFGYWYAPEGRNTAEQAAFEAVEEKPQALEWLFSLACGYPFQVSVDNLDPACGELPDTQAFRERVLARARDWQRCGLPGRAGVFFAALARDFGTGAEIETVTLRIEDLR